MIDGKKLIAMGYRPANWFGHVIEHANQNDLSDHDLRAYIETVLPPPTLDLNNGTPYDMYIDGETEAELGNITKVRETMDQLMQTPTLTYGQVMPDACPAGPVGTIPVGGVVVATNAIHPGMHSADICCSVMLTEFNSVSPKELLDRIHATTHFGPGGRTDFQPPHDLMEKFLNNPLLRTIVPRAMSDFGTQGDGNHFSYVGISEKTGKTCLITHHGSRGPGALLYKMGMKIAERFRHQLSPQTLKQNAWIPFDTQEGQDYWDALQVMRDWTKANHMYLHFDAGMMLDITDQFWNEHNFVFRDGENFIHAKGATPLLDKYLPDTCGRSIIPLNMAEPILIVRSHDSNGLGFAPHGAGRNLSRTAHKKSHGEKLIEEIFAEETLGIDARFFSGYIDVSELPSAYKNADQVVNQIDKYNLAMIDDRIMPYGSIMAGDWQIDAPWKRNRGSVIR